MTLLPTEFKRKFEQDGFVVIPNLLTRKESEAYKHEMKRVVASVRQEAIAAGKVAEDVLRTGVYVGVAARSKFYRQAVADERLLQILALLIGPDIEFLSDKAVFKDKETEFSSPWHQDWPYWQGSHKISLWVALDDVTPDNGCMKFIPGSHRSHAVHDGEAGDGLGFGHRLDPDAVDESKAVTAVMEAGSVAFFHDLMLHASHPNSTGKDRWVWIPTYRNAHNDDPDYEWAVAARVVRSE